MILPVSCWPGPGHWCRVPRRAANYIPKHAAPPSGVPAAVPVSAVLAAAVPVALGALAPAGHVDQDARAVHQVPAARPLVTRVTSVSSGKSYTVAAGDTLSGIAGKLCGNPGDWPGIWHANQAEIHRPDLIYPGQVLRFTCAELSAGPVPGSMAVRGPAPSPGAPGAYSCTALESLWEQARGSPSEAFMAAEIARAESGGNPNAISVTDDLGLWQVNRSAHPTLATFDPLANAEAAVSISSDGRDWSPWTTDRTGAYRGQC